MLFRSFESWKNMLGYFQNSQIYNIRWESYYLKKIFFRSFKKNTSIRDLFKIIVKDPSFLEFISQNEDYKTKETVKKCFIKLRNILFLALYESILKIHDLLNIKIDENDRNKTYRKIASKVMPSFEKCRAYSDQAGAFLALLIALRIPFNVEAISFVSFSLGTEVVKSCLENLKVLNIYDKVHDVILMGGTAQLNPFPNHQKKYSDCVSGQIINCYSENDSILKQLHHINKAFRPIGIYPYQPKAWKVQSTKDLDNSSFREIKSIENNYRHYEYRNHLFKLIRDIFRRIK